MLSEETRKEKTIHKVFVWGILLKAVDGVLETLAGIVLFFPNTLTTLVQFLILNELIEDPHDFLMLQLKHALPILSGNSFFFALYLISHGLIKIILVAGILRDKIWAYQGAIALFTLFIVYQLYRYLFSHSIFLLVLTVLDMAVIWLTWHEYRYFRKHHAFAR